MSSAVANLFLALTFIVLVIRVHGQETPICTELDSELCPKLPNPCTNTNLLRFCKKFCGACIDPSAVTTAEATTTTRLTTTPNNKCVDRTDFCIGKEDLCRPESTFNTLCPFTCGLCAEPVKFTSQPTTHLTTFPQSRCFDRLQYCQSQASLCKVQGGFQSLCPVTCGLCQPTTTSSSTQAPTTRTTAQDDCKDKSKVCSTVASQCNFNPSVPVLCPMTCGLCGSTVVPFKESTTPTKPECSDRYSFCESIMNQCDVNPAVTTLCSKTCGKCSSPVVKEQPTSTTERIITTLQDTNCQDRSTLCASQKALCTTTNAVKLLCPVTCGTCGSQTSERPTTITARPATTRQPTTRSTTEIMPVRITTRGITPPCEQNYRDSPLCAFQSEACTNPTFTKFCQKFCRICQ